MNYLSPQNLLSIAEVQELNYAYTGPAPVAYGTHTKAVLENIFRPYSYFNKNGKVSDIKAIKSGSKQVEEINTKGPSSGFHLPTLEWFAHNFFEKYEKNFSPLMKWMSNGLQEMKYNELAKGRQTYSFLQNKNIPAACALEETVDFLRQNLNRNIGDKMIDFLQAVCDVLELETTSYEYETITYKYEIDDILEEDEEESSSLRVKKKKKMVKTFTQSQLWDQMRKLNTMWKHLERGRLNRRTIATPSMLVRGFVKIVEDGAKVLLEQIESSGLPVGGEEKLAKLASKLLLDKSRVTGELSGDQEKFNECLDPDAMRIMWEIFLRRCNRPEWEIELFSLPFLVFKSKIADIGEGLTYQQGKIIKTFPFGTYESEFDMLKPLIVQDGEEVVGIECTLGMFMGMYNLSSTLLALISSDQPEITGSHVEGSDDFIHFTYADSKAEMLDQVEKLRLSMKFVGINFSPSKCILISPAGIGEFNSKFHNREFVGNIATEIPSLFPNGLNPMSDLTMGLNVIKHSLNTNQMNMCTASLAIRLFIQQYKYCYWVSGQTKRTNFMVSHKIPAILTNQGADNVHSVSTLHLDEIALRYKLELIDKDQLRRLLNPNNPITSHSDPVISYRIENKMPELKEDTSVGSIFKYEFSRNRTIITKPNAYMLEKENKYREIVQMLEKLYPELLVKSMDIPGSFKECCHNQLLNLIHRSGLSSTDQDLLIELLEKE